MGRRPESGPVMTDASIEQHIRETLPTAMPTNTWSNEFVRALLRRLDAARESEKAALDSLEAVYVVTNDKGVGAYNRLGALRLCATRALEKAGRR